MRNKTINKIYVPFSQRPICENEDCTNPRHHTGHYRNDGTPIFRKVCMQHHGLRHDINGWTYKINRKTYCENLDGRLGFTCTTTIIDPLWQLDVDHIDGNPTNNDESNHQTLCKCCHVIKTRDERDYLSPGRKSLGIKA